VKPLIYANINIKLSPALSLSKERGLEVSTFRQRWGNMCIFAQFYGIYMQLQKYRYKRVTYLQSKKTVISNKERNQHLKTENSVDLILHNKITL
jgi:hypothetical protein